MSLHMTIPTKNLQIFKRIIHGIHVLMMNIYNAIATTLGAYTLYPKLFNEPESYLPSAIVLHPIGKIPLIYFFGVISIVPFLNYKFELVSTVLRTCIGGASRSKHFITKCTSPIFINHISYPIIYRTNYQL